MAYESTNRCDWVGLGSWARNEEGQRRVCWWWAEERGTGQGRAGQGRAGPVQVFESTS